LKLWNPKQAAKNNGPPTVNPVCRWTTTRLGVRMGFQFFTVCQKALSRRSISPKGEFLASNWV
jgi:hypothetical protein